MYYFPFEVVIGFVYTPFPYFLTNPHGSPAFRLSSDAPWSNRLEGGPRWPSLSSFQRFGYIGSWIDVYPALFASFQDGGYYGILKNWINMGIFGRTSSSPWKPFDVQPP